MTSGSCREGPLHLDTVVQPHRVIFGHYGEPAFRQRGQRPFVGQAAHRGIGVADDDEGVRMIVTNG